VATIFVVLSFLAAPLYSGTLLVSAGGTQPQTATPTANSTQREVCEDIDAGSNCSSPNGNSSVEIENVIKAAVRILSWIVGVMAIIMVIVSGGKYIASGGDSNKVASAKNTLIYSLLGLVIAILAQPIVGWVLDSFAT